MLSCFDARGWARRGVSGRSIWKVLLRAIAVTATTSSSASQVGRDDFDGNSLLLSKPARDRRPGILIFLARGQGAVEETVRGGRFMRKVADNTERETERESFSFNSREEEKEEVVEGSARRGEVWTLVRMEWPAIRTASVPCIIHTPVWHVKMDVVNGKGWLVSLLTNSSGKVVPFFSFFVLDGNFQLVKVNKKERI